MQFAANMRSAGMLSCVLTNHSPMLSAAMRSKAAMAVCIHTAMLNVRL